ncbi:MAG: hypothetical protein CFE28_10575 [Alphaproteobacteria bacterium PA2]|nr:MAG: hypothetical protein CFE28_10575 [Alphaproteobacteria bacterium PA2]
MFSPAIHKLQKRRSQLNQEIEREQSAPSPNWPRVHLLKKWRLAVKDALQGMAFSSPYGLPSGPAPLLIPAPVRRPPPADRPAPRPGRVRRPQNA